VSPTFPDRAGEVTIRLGRGWGGRRRDLAVPLRQAVPRRRQEATAASTG
jgi:hypothetical protein